MNINRSEKIAQDEYQLILSILGGEHNRFEDLVHRYQDMIVGMIKRQVREEATARDLAQETFLRAFKGLSKFRNYSTFSTWLTRIALNVAHSYFSSRKYRESQRSVPLSPTHLEQLSSEQPTEIEPNQSALLFLQQSIGDLKPKYREVIVLCSLEGKTYAEAGEILQVPVGTVCSRMNTALTQLRYRFAQQKAQGLI